MKRVILRSFQSPGDILMMTAAVLDLHTAHPRQFVTDVRTSTEDLWLHNPFITPLNEEDPGVETVDMHYPLIHEANRLPYHFIHGYTQFLEERLNVRIPVSEFRGDLHLAPEEAEIDAEWRELGLHERFWIIVAGGKYDFTAKWWDPANYQKVVDHFAGRIQFVQCGEAAHWHPRLHGVIDLVGKTSVRDLIRLTHHADGVVCPVTFGMHLAAAVKSRSDRPRNRACVVVAGGREPPHWEAYPHHQFISTNGALSCCSEGGCWKSRCQQVGDGDAMDRNLCEQPVELRKGLSIPRCMGMISAEDVIRRVEMYFQGGVLEYLSNGHGRISRPNSSQHAIPQANKTVEPPTYLKKVISDNAIQHQSLRFYHGLGDAAYFAKLIPLYTKRGHQVAVECTPDKKLLFEAAGATILQNGEATAEHLWAYPAEHLPRAEHGRFWLGSKMGHNISEPPLAHIGPKDELWDEYVSSRVDIRKHITDHAIETVRYWLDRLQKPIVLFHQKGNTAQERKSLPDIVASEFYERFIDQCAGTLILLDWDHRVPRLSSHRVRHLQDLGTCTTELMFALMLQADLMIGVDSGPLHAAHLAEVPAIGVWMPGHYPSTYTLPRSNQLNVVLAAETASWNRYKRVPWRIAEHLGNQFTGAGLARFAADMLSEPVCLPDDRAADVQLRQFVHEFCRCRGTSSLSHYWDRNRSFDVLLKEMTKRFRAPTVVETGTIRAEEDWGGAGFFTYLMGAYLMHRGGQLDSVDIGPENCRFAEVWTNVFGDCVRIHCQDSLTFLRQYTASVDVLYVDSLDTTEPNHAEHALLEVQAIQHRLSEDSLIVFDDSPWNAGATVGKGAKAVPWLVQQGWHILYAGYQVVMSRTA